MKQNRRLSITYNELSDKTKIELWQVYRKQYPCEFPFFILQLEHYNYIAIYTVEERIIGFMGVRINRTEVEGKQYLLLNFGAPVMQKDYAAHKLEQYTIGKLLVHYWKDLLLGRLLFWYETVEERRTSSLKPSKYIQALVQFVQLEYAREIYCTREDCWTSGHFSIHKKELQIAYRFFGVFAYIRKFYRI